MADNQMQAISTLNNRQKVMAAVFAVILIIIIWQVVGMMGGGSSSKNNATITPVQNNAAATPSIKPGTPGNGMGNSGMGAPSPMQVTPQVTQLMPTDTAPVDPALLKMQQDAEAKYVAALNELQMLKISRQIAEANKAIRSAQFDAVNSEKKIVDLLAGPAPVVQAPTVNTINTMQMQQSYVDRQIVYTVVSVSELQNRWTAVLNSNGNLYNVHVGDNVPADGSTVVSIDRNGVMLSKDGATKRISLVPII